MTDEHRPVVAGVDTHKDTHHAAVISGTGETTRTSTGSPSS